ncbi:DUF7678 domain-containing protein [Mesorhizobium waimense]|uniref:DUF7678 domain-containing protein n=1 Tax=Mesorhizobium waimense TaxID=1300307 RepID=UPI003CCA8DE9
MSGSVNENPAYSFTAKVFDVGSRYGLDGGQISKLSLYHGGHEVASYDRDWTTRPRHKTTSAQSRSSKAHSRSVNRPKTPTRSGCTCNGRRRPQLQCR